MGILLVVLLMYFVWGLPALIAFNYFFTRSFVPEMDWVQSSALTFVLSLILFMPLTNPSGSFFGDTPMPWYVAVCIKPTPYFDALNAAVAALTSATSIALFQWMARRK